MGLAIVIIFCLAMMIVGALAGYNILNDEGSYLVAVCIWLMTLVFPLAALEAFLGGV